MEKKREIDPSLSNRIELIEDDINSIQKIFNDEDLKKYLPPLSNIKNAIFSSELDSFSPEQLDSVEAQLQLTILDLILKDITELRKIPHLNEEIAILSSAIRKFKNDSVDRLLPSEMLHTLVEEFQRLKLYTNLNQTEVSIKELIETISALVTKNSSPEIQNLEDKYKLLKDNYYSHQSYFSFLKAKNPSKLIELHKELVQLKQALDQALTASLINQDEVLELHNKKIQEYSKKFEDQLKNFKDFKDKILKKENGYPLELIAEVEESFKSLNDLINGITKNWHSLSYTDPSLLTGDVYRINKTIDKRLKLLEDKMAEMERKQSSDIVALKNQIAELRAVLDNVKQNVAGLNYELPDWELKLNTLLLTAFDTQPMTYQEKAKKLRRLQEEVQVEAEKVSSFNAKSQTTEVQQIQRLLVAIQSLEPSNEIVDAVAAGLRKETLDYLLSSKTTKRSFINSCNAILSSQLSSGNLINLSSEESLKLIDCIINATTPINSEINLAELERLKKILLSHEVKIIEKFIRVLQDEIQPAQNEDGRIEQIIGELKQQFAAYLEGVIEQKSFITSCIDYINRVRVRENKENSKPSSHSETNLDELNSNPVLNLITIVLTFLHNLLTPPVKSNPNCFYQPATVSKLSESAQKIMAELENLKIVITKDGSELERSSEKPTPN